jgi:hypothetical protein
MYVTYKIFLRLITFNLRYLKSFEENKTFLTYASS